MVFSFGSRKTATAQADEIAGVEPAVSDSSFEQHGDEKRQLGDEKTNAVPAPALSDEEAARRLRLFRAAAEHDPNLEASDLGAIDEAVGGHDVSKENELVDELVENSPYPEVRLPAPAAFPTV